MARVGLIYAALCAVALWVSRRDLLGMCTDSRDGVIRELIRAPEAADTLFLGSSQTARALIPAVYDKRIEELTGRPSRSLNLAPFGAGRHIGFLELQEWLKRHDAPSTLVVEAGVTSDVVEVMHQMLPRFMDPRDARRMLRHRPYRYRDAKEQGRKTKHPPRIDPLGAFTELDRFAMHLELALEVLGRGPEDCTRALFNRIATSGDSVYWKPSVPDLVAQIDVQLDERGYFRIAPDSLDGLEGKKKVAERNRQISYEDALRQTWDKDDDFMEPRRYVPAKLYGTLIAELCRARGIRLVFLEIPNYRGQALRPSQIEFCRSLGELAIFDKGVLYREESFQDAGHLSVQGAEYMSRTLAEFVAANARKTQ